MSVIYCVSCWGLKRRRQASRALISNQISSSGLEHHRPPPLAGYSHLIHYPVVRSAQSTVKSTLHSMSAKDLCLEQHTQSQAYNYTGFCEGRRVCADFMSVPGQRCCSRLDSMMDLLLVKHWQRVCRVCNVATLLPTFHNSTSRQHKNSTTVQPWCTVTSKRYSTATSCCTGSLPVPAALRLSPASPGRAAPAKRSPAL